LSVDLSVTAEGLQPTVKIELTEYLLYEHASRHFSRLKRLSRRFSTGAAQV